LKTTPYIYTKKNNCFFIKVKGIISLIFIVLSIQVLFSQNEKNLLIEGSDPFSDLIIKQLKPPTKISNDSLLLDQLSRFRKKLDFAGFIDHSLDSVYSNKNMYHVRIKLQPSIKTIRFSHPDLAFISKEFNYQLIDSITIEIPFAKTSDFLDNLSSYYKNRGYPFVKIKSETIKRKKEKLLVILKATKQQKRKIDKIVTKGYNKFPKSFTKYFFNINEGATYNKQEITQISEYCNSLSFISEIKPAQILFSKDSTALYLFLKKEKSNRFDGILGFSNNPRKKGLQLFGNINLEIVNAFDSGEQLKLNWLANQNQSQTLELSVKTPYIFNSAFSFSYDFDIYKKDSTFLTIAHQVVSNYQIVQRQKLGFIAERVFSNKTSITENVDLQDFNSFFYGFTYKFLKPKAHPLFFKKLEIENQMSQGKRNGEKQYKIKNNIQYLYEISQKHNIFFNTQAALLISNNYLENELFRLGGSNSIRGFDEGSLLANSFIYINNEYNYLINEQSFLSGLLDYGYLKNKIRNTSTFIYSIGIGYSQNIKTSQ